MQSSQIMSQARVFSFYTSYVGFADYVVCVVCEDKQGITEGVTSISKAREK